MRRLVFPLVFLLTACPDAGDDDDTPSPAPAEPPVIEVVVFDPAEPRTDDLLGVIATVTAGAELEYAWTVNGEAAGADATLDGADAFDKGDEVEVEVVATLDDLRSAPVSAQVTIANTPPSAPGVSINVAPAVDDDLVCTITDADDADGDALEYLIAWEVGGVSATADASDGVRPGDTIPASLTNPAEGWACVVVAFDGDDTSAEVRVETTVADGDADGDGVADGADCDPRNAVVYPGAPDACDGWDNDCDGVVEELVAYWPFDADLDDATGAGANLTAPSAPTFVQDGACDGAAAFDQRIATVNDPGSLSNFYRTEGLTVAFWARPQDCSLGGQSGGCPYISKGPVDALEYSISTTSALTESNAAVLSGTGSAGGFLATNHPALSGWQSFALTFDPTGSAAALHHNGVLKDTDAVVGNGFQGGTLAFGTSPVSGLQRASQDLDEARIYRCAIPEQLLTAHYTCGGCGCQGGASPCAASEYWTGSTCAPIR